MSVCAYYFHQSNVSMLFVQNTTSKCHRQGLEGRGSWGRKAVRAPGCAQQAPPHRKMQPCLLLLLGLALLLPRLPQEPAQEQVQGHS